MQKEEVTNLRKLFSMIPMISYSSLMVVTTAVYWTIAIVRKSMYNTHFLSVVC
jgi:hypothetical protein